MENGREGPDETATAGAGGAGVLPSTGGAGVLPSTGGALQSPSGAGGSEGPALTVEREK